MNLRSKYEQPANVPVVNNAVRFIAGQQHNLADTGTGLYASQEQACHMLGVSEKTYRNHLEAEYAEYEASQQSGGGASHAPPPHFLTVLLVQVVQCMNEFGDIVESDNAANYPIEGQVIQASTIETSAQSGFTI